MTIIRLSDRDRSDRQSKSGIVSSTSKSKKSSKSGGVTPIFKALSTNDFEKVSIPDMIETLSHDAHLYCVEYHDKNQSPPEVSIYDLPENVINLISFLKPKLNTDRPPSIKTCLCFFLTHGLEILQSNESVQMLINIRHKLFNSHTQTGCEKERFMIQVINMNATRDKEPGKKISFPVTEWVSINLGKMTEELGLKVTDLAVMCLYAYLTTQPDHCPEKFVDKWAGFLDDFMSVVEMKAEGVDRMMKVVYREG